MIRRSSLLLRFFVMSVLIAAFSIAVTAWLASQTTTRNIQQQTGESVARDARLYDALLGYAATHTSWDGVRPMLDELEEESGRRIALTTADRAPIADTADRGAPPLPLQRDALIDPLRVDTTLQRGAPANLIDRRAVATLAPLSPAYRRDLHAAADRLVTCVRDRHGIDAQVTSAPNGRPTVLVPDMADLTPAFQSQRCLGGHTDDLVRLTDAEERANHDFNARVLTCLEGDSVSAGPSPPPPSPSPSATGTAAAPSAGVTTAPSGSVSVTATWEGPHSADHLPELMPAQLWTDARSPDHYASLAASPDVAPETRGCFATALRGQLAGRVAPPALVFLTAPHGPAPASADLSSAGAARITLTAALVLVVAALAAWLGAIRLVRPLRAVTSAAHRMTAGDRTTRVISKAPGEVGELADAFNAMSAQLERTERQRQALISDIAHELRNPLGNITGWLEATHDGLATADPELIDMLLNESTLLQRLVDDLQDLAQADAGTLRLHPELIDANDVADQVAAAHQAAADDRNVTLRSITRGHLPVVADPARVRQALGNLVSNAVRHTPPGGHITIRTSAENNDIVLDVTDTGCGISAEELPHVFDRFWRSDISRSRRTGGTGLGLAITKHLCRAHGGTVSATSEPDRGSTFRITLPRDGLPAAPDGTHGRH